MSETAGSSAPSPQRARQLQELGVEINRRVSQLQTKYLANKESAPRATLAHLRAAATRSPGSVPAIWELTIDGLPGSTAYTRDETTRAERASHTALTLYGAHQQSRTEPMHVKEIGLGHAVRRLGPRGSSTETTVRRRFDAVATASTFEGTAHHLRALVGQLRAARIPLDYGQLADDLLWLQNPTTSDRIRLRWARQYYAASDTATDNTAVLTDMKES